jgi:hypothetical protein
MRVYVSAPDTRTLTKIDATSMDLLFFCTCAGSAAGEVGEYDGEVGEYDGEVAEYDGEYESESESDISEEGRFGMLRVCSVKLCGLKPA